MSKMIRLESTDLKKIISEAVIRILKEGITDTLQPRLQKIVKSSKIGGDIRQINLPNNVQLSSIADGDIEIVEIVKEINANVG